MTPTPDDPIDRDAWLQQALRHAPDADAAPPPAVRDAILARARQATPAPAGPPRGIGAWWSWLARPPVAAGFATLALSTVIGTLWWGGSLDEGADPRPAAVREAASPAPAPGATSPAPQDAATPASAAGPAGVPSPPTSPDAVRSRAAPQEPADAPRRASKGRPAGGQTAPAAPPAPAPAGPTVVPAAPPPAPPAPDAPDETTAAPPPAPPAPSVATASAAMPDARAESARVAERTRSSEWAAAERREAGDRAAAARASPGAAADTARSFAPAAPQALQRRAADPLDPLARLLDERGAALHWTWAGRPHAHGPATQAWFDALRAATAGRWQRSDAATDAPGASMQLFDGPRVRAEWRIAPDRVLWLDPALGTRQAPLAPEDAARLRTMADGW